MLISLYQMATEVAGITGKDCKVFYGDYYAIRSDGVGGLEMVVPSGISYIDPSVRSSIIHEAMHGKYTEFYCEEDMVEVWRQAGVKKPAEQQMLKEFLNAFEDVRIELKGAEEYPGCRWIFQDGFDFELPTIMTNQDNMMKGAGGNQSNQMLAKARLFLIMQILYLPGYYPYPSWMYPGWNKHDLLIEHYTSKLFAKWWEQQEFLKGAGDALGNKYTKYDVQLAIEDVGYALRDTKSTVDCFLLAAKIFLPAYLRMLPPDLKELQDKQNGEARAIAALNALAQAIGQGKVGKSTGAQGQPIPEKEGKMNGSTSLGRAQQGNKEGDEKYSPTPTHGGYGKSEADDVTRQRDQRKKVALVMQKAQEIKMRLAPVLQEIKEYQDTGGEATHLKKGKLDANKLFRVIFGEENVFKKDINPEFNDDVAFSVVIDTSGSMFDGDQDGNKNVKGKQSVERAVAAVAVGAGINQALEYIGRNTSVASFSDSGVLHVKNGERMTERHVEDVICTGGGGTSVLKGAVVGIEQLEDEPRSSKILMIITDGYVYDHELGEIDKQCKDKKITPYFIFVGLDNRKGIEETLAKQMKNKYYQAFFGDGEEMMLVNELGKFVQDLLLRKN